MFQFLLPIATSIIGGLIQGATSKTGSPPPPEKEKPQFTPLKKERNLRPVAQADTGSRLTPQDPMVRSQAMDMLRARMNQGA